MSQSGINSIGASGGIVNSVTGANGVTASPTTGNVVVSGVNATTSTVGVASFNPADFTVTAGVVSTNNNGTITSVLTAHATPQFALTGTTETVDFGLTNLILGTSGSSITSATLNVGLGSTSMTALTSGTGNTGIGYGTLTGLTSGDENICLGYFAGHDITTGSDNILIGAGAGESFTTLSGNTIIGYSGLVGLNSGNGNNTGVGFQTLSNISSGAQNIALGYQSGSQHYTTDSSNIDIGNVGTNGDNNTIRIGTQGSGAGQQNKNIQAGITGVTVSASAPVAVDTNGQLSSLGFGTSTQVLTSNGPGESPTWQAGGGFTPVNFAVKLSGNIGGVTGDGTQYLIAYDTVTFDSASGFNTGTYLYTIPTTGVYQFNCTWFVYESSGTSTSASFLGFLLINGSTNIRLADASPNTLGLTTNSEFMQGGTYLYNATAGDTIGMYVELSGGTKNIGVAGGTESCLFSGFRVA